MELTMNIPDLGIYDTSAWDAAYQMHVTQQGPIPGEHPDPECIWNKNPNAYNEDKYIKYRDGLIAEAKKNRWI